MKNSTAVGHVPRKISSVCSLFLRKNGTLVCKVTGSRRYSRDMPQGGLEIPCTQVSREYQSEKTARCRPSTTSVVISQAPPTKKRKLGSAGTEGEPHRWVQHGDILLSTEDKAGIISGQQLNDEHINFAQKLLKAQFPCLNGLHSTLLHSHKQSLPGSEQVVQIVHSRGNQWIAVSSLNSSDRTVNVYDSLYDTLDGDTEDIINSLFQPHSIKLKVVPSQRQESGRDCGLFSITNITALAFSNPTTITFDQAAMRRHLIECMEKHNLTPFPTKQPCN